MPLPVYVPSTRVREATRVYLAQLRDHPVHQVDVSAGRWAYVDYWQQRWDEGLAFISLEHDVVPWPGAIDDLEACPEQWCFFGYMADVDCVANDCAPFGLVKFGAKLITAASEVWQQMRIALADDPKPWSWCDVWMYKCVAKGKGIIPHQHYPAVLNANPQAHNAYFPVVEPDIHEVTVWAGKDSVALVEVRGDAEFSVRSAPGYVVAVNEADRSKCCGKCGRFYDLDAVGRRHCDPCGFWPDGFPMERLKS